MSETFENGHAAFLRLPSELRLVLYRLIQLNESIGFLTVQQIDASVDQSVPPNCLEDLMVVLDALNVFLLDEDDFKPGAAGTKYLEEKSRDPLVERVDRLLKSLPDREREVISLRFGLLDGICRSLEEVGRCLRISKEDVKGLEISAFRKLRHPTFIRSQLGLFDVSEESPVVSTNGGDCVAGKDPDAPVQPLCEPPSSALERFRLESEVREDETP